MNKRSSSCWPYGIYLREALLYWPILCWIIEHRPSQKKKKRAVGIGWFRIPKEKPDTFTCPFLVHRHCGGCLLSLMYIIKYKYKGSSLFLLYSILRSLCVVYDCVYCTLYGRRILIEDCGWKLNILKLWQFGCVAYSFDFCLFLLFYWILKQK